MNKYKAFFNGKSTEISADTKYAAQQKAVEFFKPVKSKSHMVHVELLAVGEREIIHVAVN